MIDKLTKEQESKIPDYFKKWSKIGKDYKKIDRDKAKGLLSKYLGYANIKPKYYLFFDSPMACQLAINLLKNNSQLNSQLRSQLRSQLYSQLGSQLDSQLGSQLYSQLGSQLRSQLYSQLNSQLNSQLDSQLDSQDLEYFPLYYFYTSANINSGYCAFYDFLISEVKEVDSNTREVWDVFKSISSELHYFFVFEDFVFVSEKPKKLEFKVDNLHSESSPSVLYNDGYSIYSWEGVSVPEQLIRRPDSITKEDLEQISNAEIKRCYMEKLGAKKFYDIMTDGKGVKKIDSEVDNNGNIMTLWETKEPDSTINKIIQFLECECPSTGRVYNLYPPSQKHGTFWRTCLDAKEDTFGKEKLYYRHGDVGLVKIGSRPSLPIAES